GSALPTRPPTAGRPAARTTFPRSKGDRQADQVPDLQPPPLRSHRRRQAVQGRRRHHRRSSTGQGAPRRAQGSEHAAPRSGRERCRPHDQARRHYARAENFGLNHSDSNLVMWLPKEKIVFVVDTIPVGSFPGRGFIDIYPLETEQFIKKVLALDWEKLIPGHPGQPAGRLGAKKDAQDILTLMQEASAEMKKMGQDGKCWEPAEKDFKLPKYANWPGYENGLQFVARRYCGLWGRGT